MPLLVLLDSVCVDCNEDAVRTKWRRVVDMSLSAPAQAVRGTRTGSLDQLDFQERRQLIASSLSLTDFLHVGAKEVAAVAGQLPFPFCLIRRIPNNSFAKSKTRAWYSASIHTYLFHTFITESTKVLTRALIDQCCYWLAVHTYGLACNVDLPGHSVLV